MAILGLISTESFKDQTFKSVRRKVFYDYPNGRAPLTGILSLTKEERASDPQFEWWEKRFQEQKTITQVTGASCFFGSGAGTDNSHGTTERNTNITITQGQKLTIRVADGTFIREGHVIRIPAAVMATGVAQDLVFRVLRTAIISSGPAYHLHVHILFTPGAAIDFDANNGKEVLVVGSAFGQGAVGASTSGWNKPTRVKNYTEIFRTEFRMTRTATKTAAAWDSEGPYKDRAKEASVNHMVELERAFLFGKRYVDTTGATLTSSDLSITGTDPVFYTGGILQHLLEWEAANGNLTPAAGGGTDSGSGYREGGAAVTLNSEDEKRILDLSASPLTEKDYDKYLERVFRVTQSSDNSKLVLCGSGFLNIINQLYKSKSVLNADLPMTETYGMAVVAHQCPFGTLYYKTHPLFSQNSILRFNALILDVGNLAYRYIDDTDLLENRQPNNADYRMDEWLTECGLEVRYPESHMYMQNVLDFAP